MPLSILFCTLWIRCFVNLRNLRDLLVLVKKTLNEVGKYKQQQWFPLRKEVDVFQESTDRLKWSFDYLAKICELSLHLFLELQIQIKPLLSLQKRPRAPPAATRD